MAETRIVRAGPQGNRCTASGELGVAKRGRKAGMAGPGGGGRRARCDADAAPSNPPAKKGARGAGDIFVQTSDDNLHRVRSALAEDFGNPKATECVRVVP